MYFKVVLIFALFAICMGQNEPRIKSGDCPPPTSVGICELTCRRDIECSGQAKCCPTSCGGTTCIMPVTMRKPSYARSEKSGNCPARPMGAWVCSSTCSYDSDCRGKLKCCRGRCPGSMSCVKAEL